eukprot:6042518-Amphidinium_carterae.1
MREGHSSRWGSSIVRRLIISEDSGFEVGQGESDVSCEQRELQPYRKESAQAWWVPHESNFVVLKIAGNLFEIGG